MDIKRLVLYLALALVGVALWNTWVKDYPPEAEKNRVMAETPAQATQSAIKAGEFKPGTFNPNLASVPTTNPSPEAVIPAQRLVQVKTDVLNVKIDTVDGNIVDVSLPKYPESTQNKNIPIQILNSNPEELYIIQSGITNTEAGESSAIQYKSAQKVYVMDKNAKELQVVLQGKTNNGLQVTKTFVFNPGLYRILTNYQIKNVSNKTWGGSIYHQIVRKNVPTKSTGFHAQSHDFAALSLPDKPYQKFNYKTLDELNLNRASLAGWIAMEQQYFLSALIPDKDQLHKYYSHVVFDPAKHNVYTIGYASAEIKLEPQQTHNNQTIIYVGPEDSHQLKPIAPYLDLTIDYGWLWPISKLLFWVMDQINTVVGNWGWSIILVTLLIKIIFYPFSAKSYQSMAKMRDLQPRIQSLKERYGDDKQGFSKAIMEFYRKEKVNPMGGCLPMLIQIPVFIALYYVLIESVELRQAPFMLWIQDLSSKDPYYILPILMGISMLLQQKLSPAPPDPMQARLMLLLPIVFTVFLLSFPAGLVLYWLTNNLISILQQWYVMKTHHKTKSKEYSKKVRE